MAGRTDLKLRWNEQQWPRHLRPACRPRPAVVEEKIAHFLEEKPTSEEGTCLGLQPLIGIHLGAGLEYDFSGRQARERPHGRLLGRRRDHRGVPAQELAFSITGATGRPRTDKQE